MFLLNKLVVNEIIIHADDVGGADIAIPLSQCGCVGLCVC